LGQYQGVPYTYQSGKLNQYSSVAITPDGEATVVWAQNDGTRENAWALRFDSLRKQ
jgi:hypothetical protein